MIGLADVEVIRGLLWGTSFPYSCLDLTVVEVIKCWSERTNCIPLSNVSNDFFTNLSPTVYFQLMDESISLMTHIRTKMKQHISFKCMVFFFFSGMFKVSYMEWFSSHQL